jgi:hypothetical protein
LAAVHKLQAAQRAGASITAEPGAARRDSVTSLTDFAHECALSIEQRLEELRSVLGPILPAYSACGEDEGADRDDSRPLAVRRLASLCARLELIERAVSVLAVDAAI